MKHLIVLCCVVAAVIAEDKYTDKYDSINVDEILGNKRLLDAFAECLRGTGPCSHEGSELKAHIEDALQTGCSKCTEKQQQETPRIMKYLIKNERALWDEAVAKYDPTGKWQKKYEERAKAEGIEIS